MSCVPLDNCPSKKKVFSTSPFISVFLTPVSTAGSPEDLSLNFSLKSLWDKLPNSVQDNDVSLKIRFHLKQSIYIDHFLVKLTFEHFMKFLITSFIMPCQKQH